MEPAPIQENEKERLEALYKLGILDTEPEERFDKLTKEAVVKLHVPISTISIIDANREWFKSCQGLNQKEGDRKASFCGHALLNRSMLVIEDATKDNRFADNPMVVGPPYIRFYAGAPLYDFKTRHPVGVFCVKDTKPRKLSTEEVSILLGLANQAEQELNNPKGV